MSCPLVFLHGFLGSKHDFSESIKLLETHFNCFSFDLPGHGTADLPSKPSYDFFLEKIDGFLQENQIKKCHLIGYSMGGRLALLFTQRYCQKVDKLVIISSHLGIEDKKERKARLLQDQVWAKKMQDMSVDDFLNQWYAQPLFNHLRSSTDRFSEIIKRRKKMNPSKSASVMQNLSVGKQKPLWNELANFKQEMLFICGNQDEKYCSLYNKIPTNERIKIATIHDAGHAPHLEKPEEFALELTNFLGKTS